jgi:NAD(P)-dependent dehydrogenase (short-subunit alcohol dehydrogenase family)
MADHVDLNGRVAVVAGGTRGAGRATAIELGAAGATVYVTGRTTEANASPMNRPETIEETARLVDQAGGTGIAVRTDHTEPDQVGALADTVGSAHGRLDILVNDIWGGDPLTDWEHPFWEQDLQQGFALLRQAIDSHIITSWHLAPLLIQSDHGLLVEVTDGVSARYRGTLFYDLVKTTVARLAVSKGADLRPHNVAAVAISPGFLRSEAMLDHFGVSVDKWRDAISQDEHFAYSETPHYLGRAIAALAADPDRMRHSGTTTATWELYEEYGFTDLDGTQPDWGRHARDDLQMEP